MRRSLRVIVGDKQVNLQDQEVTARNINQFLKKISKAKSGEKALFHYTGPGTQLMK